MQPVHLMVSNPRLPRAAQRGRPRSHWPTGWGTAKTQCRCTVQVQSRSNGSSYFCGSTSTCSVPNVTYDVGSGRVGSGRLGSGSLLSTLHDGTRPASLGCGKRRSFRIRSSLREVCRVTNSYGNARPTFRPLARACLPACLPVCLPPRMSNFRYFSIPLATTLVVWRES